VIITVVTGCSPSLHRRPSSCCSVSRVSASSAPNGLVEKQHLRLRRERASDRDTLTHAAGELPRPAIDRIAEADMLECACRVAPLFVARHLGERRLDRKPHVLERGEPGEKRVVLKHETRRRAGRRESFRRQPRHCRNRARSARQSG
jgi:hypothetical protein